VSTHQCRWSCSDAYTRNTATYDTFFLNLQADRNTKLVHFIVPMSRLLLRSPHVRLPPPWTMVPWTSKPRWKLRMMAAMLARLELSIPSELPKIYIPPVQFRDRRSAHPVVVMFSPHPCTIRSVLLWALHGPADSCITVSSSYWNAHNISIKKLSTQTTGNASKVLQKQDLTIHLQLAQASLHFGLFDASFRQLVSSGSNFVFLTSLTKAIRNARHCVQS
jgi:hypothetical protein